ncbi:hypothetical protein [Nonomuraea guangzhouensis]|uniref:Uncharacterized protein n=1 Tax=Nonomuraea guangzhouensis TaxID=1291555 RepID=A0ABW4GZA6_9ACTN|nr:hypothetical protein [Nonomuraea guangzhouensis]
MPIKCTLLGATTIITLGALGASPAYADDPQPLPGNPDVVVGYDNETEVFRAKAGPVETRACHRGDHHYEVTSYSNSHKAIGARQSNHNGTPNVITSTFSATVSGTVSMTWSANVSVKVDRLIAGAELGTGVNLSASLTASLGNSVSVSTQPRKTVTATYGVWRKKTIGTYTICAVRMQRGVKAWTPWRVGWYVVQH